MGRLLACVMACALATPALAGSSLLSGGYANWFYACANGEPMTIIVRHRDRSFTQFALLPGEITRTSVQRGDVVATRCDARSVPLTIDKFTAIVTVP